MNVRVVIGAVLTAVAVSGCVREPEGQFVASARVAKLDPKFRLDIGKALTEHCGTPLAPKLAGEPKASPARLAQGAKVYTKLCRQCHGVSGDGKGPAAAHMLPRPRDYRPGIFKFTSTVYGSKPLREDLIRTVTRGIAGTSMPSFRIQSREDVEAVVDYVIALSRRGELETQLADAVEFDGAIDPKEVPGMVDALAARWTAARGQVVFPVTPMPVLTVAHPARTGRSRIADRRMADSHKPAPSTPRGRRAFPAAAAQSVTCTSGPHMSDRVKPSGYGSVGSTPT